MTKKVKKPETIARFALKYSISLFFGWVFAGLIISLVTALTTMLVTGDYSQLAGGGGVAFAWLISSLIVFGVLYLAFTWCAGKNLRKNYTEHLWVRVMAIIYAVGLAVTAVCFLVSLIVPLVNAGVGLVDLGDKTVLAQIVSSAIACVILLKMIGYALQVPKWGGRGLYVWCLTIISAAAITLFMIFPASYVRDATQDQNIINDLDKISSAIKRYVGDNEQLPANLTDLGDGRLNRDISAYDYQIINQPSYDDSNAKYQLCADGFLTDTKTSDYWNSRSYDILQIHTAGYNCFDMSKYVSISSFDLFKELDTSTQPSIPTDGINYFD